ncbi:MAG: hypothetical protein G01um101429_678 [Parcubacteria group bacterium Gr01-1014_29]|nr:MAG: hypothetical protein G01um101429_678 [Parcubacteria group bacterium Gr01-1014_29]
MSNSSDQKQRPAHVWAVFIFHSYSLKNTSDILKTMKNSYENVAIPVPAERHSKRGEKRETRERVRDKEKLLTELIEKHLIVKDGYNWDSPELPEVLPTMFHGTSEYFLEDILENGIRPNTVNLEAIEKESPDIAEALRKQLHEEQHNEISITTSFKIALKKAQGTPERYSNVARDQFITYKGNYPQGVDQNNAPGGRDIDYLPRNSETKKLFLSVFNPRAAVVSLRPHKEDIDPELIKKGDPTTSFFIDAEYKKQFLANIKEMRSWLIQYVEEKRRNKGKTTFSIEEVSKMNSILGGTAFGMFRSRREIEMFTPGELAEIFFRAQLYEIRMHNIAPDRITGIQRIRIPKPKESEKIAKSTKTLPKT